MTSVFSCDEVKGRDAPMAGGAAVWAGSMAAAGRGGFCLAVIRPGSVTLIPGSEETGEDRRSMAGGATVWLGPAMSVGIMEKNGSHWLAQDCGHMLMASILLEWKWAGP